MYDKAAQILEGISVIAAFLCGKLKVEPVKSYKWITRIVKAVSVIYFFVELLKDGLVFSVLQFMQENPYSVCIYIGIVAVLSPITALIELWLRHFPAKKCYIIFNLIFNVIGAIAACAIFMIAHGIVYDFSVLEDFQIEGVISIFFPACAAFVLLYQREEQNNPDVKDHDPHINWFNQKVNMLHLFNVYFLSIISAIYIVTYTIYCRIHNMQILMNGQYFWFLGIALFFFYVLSFKKYEYFYVIFILDVPAILISSVYWMSWFEMSDEMLKAELWFIIVNLLVFTWQVLWRNKIIVIGKQPEHSENYRLKLKWKNYGIWLKSSFYIVSTVFVMLAYVFIWVVPMTTQRIGAPEAEKYIYKICEDTGIDAGKMIENARERDMYDINNNDYDRNSYMHFVNIECHDLMEMKHILKDGSETIKYDDLSEWYWSTP